MKIIKIIFILTVLISCSKKKEAVFYAFTDGFMDWYSLNLYPDNKFDLHVPAIDYSGNYKLVADTIYLFYNSDNNKIEKAPVAYLIDNKKQIIRELEFDGQNHIINKSNNHWIQIVENKIKQATIID